MGKPTKSTETVQKTDKRFLTPKVTFKKRKNESRQTTYNRRRTYALDPTKGGRGVCIKQRRCMTTLRRIRKSFPDSFKDLLMHTKDKKQNISPTFSEVMTGALDALANRVMELAQGYAEHRVGSTKSATGMKMLRRDLEAAIKTNRMIGQ